MEPLKPEQIAEMLKYGTQEELDEYERLLAQRFYEDPSEPMTPERQALHDAREEKLKEFYAKFYPVESALRQTPLYACLLGLPAVLGLPAEQAYIIGPKTNYVPDKESRTAIGVSPNALEIILKDVKIDGQQIKLNGRSCYDFELTKLSKTSQGRKIEGKLVRTYDFGLGHEGRDYTGSTICGYVDRIEREKDKPKIKLPEMPF